MADTRDLKSGGSVSPPNLKSPVKSSVFSFQWPEQTGISLLFSLRPPHLLFCICRCVGIGRQSRLKICQNFTSVRVRVPSAAPLRNDLWMSDDRASASISTAKVFLRFRLTIASLDCESVSETLPGKSHIDPRWLLCTFERR